MPGGRVERGAGPCWPEGAGSDQAGQVTGARNSYLAVLKGTCGSTRTRDDMCYRLLARASRSLVVVMVVPGYAEPRELHIRRCTHPTCCMCGVDSL